MDRNEKTGGKERARFSLSQETITMVTVGVALAGIILVNQRNMRAEAREDRARSDARMESLRTEARADRARIDATLNAIRAEAREDRAKSDARDALLRAEARADREAFEKQIARLIEQQGTLNGLVEGLERSIASPGR